MGDIELDCMTSASPMKPHIHPFSVATYHQMGKAGILNDNQRTELIEGRVVDMAPIGSEHADWVDRLNRYLIKRLPDEITVRVQNPIYLDEHNEPEPDIALLRPRAQPYRAAHPKPGDVLLIIEVCDTSLHYDREIKLPLYARHAIPEVWLLDARTNRLEVFRKPLGSGFQAYSKPKPEESLELISLQGLALELMPLFKV